MLRALALANSTCWWASTTTSPSGSSSPNVRTGVRSAVTSGSRAPARSTDVMAPRITTGRRGEPSATGATCFRGRVEADRRGHGEVERLGVAVEGDADDLVAALPHVLRQAPGLVAHDPGVGPAEICVVQQGG